MITKYNITSYIYSRVTVYNKFFYISFFFDWYNDKKSYFWIINNILELYVYVKREDKLEIIFMNKNKTFILDFVEIISTNYSILCI